MPNSVFVTNKNAQAHQDRFDGEDFVFNPGERVLIPVDAAIHLFGYGMADQSDILVRLGRASRYNPDRKTFEEDPDGVRWLANFVFEEAVLAPRSTLAATSAPDLEIA